MMGFMGRTSRMGLGEEFQGWDYGKSFDDGVRGGASRMGLGEKLERLGFREELSMMVLTTP